MSDHVLLFAPQMKAVAGKVHAADPGIELGEIDWKRFPDVFPDIFIRNKGELKKKHVSFLACFDRPEVIFEQMSVLYDLADFKPKSFRILLPYFPTGTMERVDTEGQIATAATLAQMISAVAPAGPGNVPLYLWDVHALQIRHYFGPNIAPTFKTGTRQLKTALGGADVTIAFPDEGAWKRFKTMFLDENGDPQYPFVICRKVRDGNKRIVSISEGVASGRRVIIIDDLIHSGGTILECAAALRAAGALSVGVYVTHGVMENDAWKKFMDAGLEVVWITDSCPTTAALVDGKGPFKVLTLTNSIINAVREGT